MISVCCFRLKDNQVTFLVVLVQWTLSCISVKLQYARCVGKIQGDGRKFLDRLKSYFGSQISFQSLNEVHIYRLQPKSATKDEVFVVFVFSYIFVFDCQFESAHVSCPLTFELVSQ